MLNRLQQWFWVLAVLVLVVLTLTVSLGRIAVRYVEPHQQEIVAELANLTGLDWQVGRIGAFWSGFSPVLKLEDLTLRSSSDAPEALQIKSASVRLSVFSSVLNRRPEVSRISVRNLEFHLAETEGQWRFADRSGGGGMSAKDMKALLNRLLELRSVQLRQTKLHLHHASGEHSELLLNYANFSGDWRFRRLNLGLASDRDGEIKLVAESYGHPLDADRFSSELWIQLDNAHYPSFSPLLPAEFEPLSHSVLNGQIWFKVRPGRDLIYSGELSSPDLPLGKLWEDNQRSVKDFFGTFGGRYSAESEKLTSWFGRLRGNWGGLPLKFPGLTVTSQVGDSLLRVELPTTRIEPLVRVVLEGSRTATPLREVLTSLEPRGVLNKVRIDLPLGADSSRFQLRAEIQGLSMEPWQGAPGVSGVSGYVDTKLDGGIAALDSAKMSVALPKVFAKPLQLEQVHGEVRYKLTSDWVYLESSIIKAEDRGAQAYATVDLELPLRNTVNEKPAMTLNIGVEGGSVSIVKDYLPRRQATSVKTWIAQALQKGDVEQASIIFRGALAGTDRVTKTTQIGATVTNTRLDYHRDWPSIEVGAAGFELADAEISANVPSAILYDGTQISDTRADLVGTEEGLRLLLKGTAKAPVNEAFKLLGDSPLRQFVGSTFEGWVGTGSADADLALDIPLYSGGVVKADVQADIEASTLATSFGLTFKDVNGRLHFDEDGIRSEALKASWLSLPVDVAVTQPKTGGVKVVATGKLNKLSLQKRFPNPLFDYVAGESDFRVEVRANRGSQMVTAISSLQGVAIDLPPPLGKAAEDSLLLLATLPLGVNPSVVTAKLGELASVTIGLDGGRYQASAITLGNGKPLQPVSDIRLGGNLGKVDAEPWRQRFFGGDGRATSKTAISSANDSADTNSSLDKSQQESNAGRGSLPTINIDTLNIERLEWGPAALDNLTVNGEHHLDNWLLMIDSDEAAGKIMVPAGGRPIQLAMSRVELPEGSLRVNQATTEATVQNTDQNSAKDKPGFLSGVDPTALVDLDLDIDRFTIGGEYRGQFGLDFRSNADGLIISHLRGELNSVNLGAPSAGSELIWRRTAQGDNSEFRGRLQTRDLGGALANFGLPVAITSSDATADVSLAWLGRPDEFSLDALNGHLQPVLRRGSFPAGDNASGALKLVGIFNLSNLVRRLQLDFTDLTSNGIQFERLSGDLRFDDGVLVIEKPIEINTGSGEFVLSGDVDFSTDQADMELAVTLPIGNNLPWVAAVLGGLPVAAGVYVASKVFEKQMDQLSTAVYKIDGDWQQPQLKLRRVFDDPDSIAKKLEKK